MKIFKFFLIVFLVLLFQDIDSMSRKRKRGENSFDDIIRQEKQERLDDALRTSVCERNLKEIKEFVRRGANINSSFENGKTALLMSTTGFINKNIEIIKYLVSLKGIEIDSRDFMGNTSLLNACRIFPHLQVIEILLVKGARVNACNKNRFTPLIEICDSRDYYLSLEAAKLLIAYGADVNKQTYQGRTALITAVKVGNINLAIFLLYCGADVTLKDNQGQDFIGWAKCRQKHILTYAYKKLVKEKTEHILKHTPLAKVLVNIVSEYLEYEI